MIADSRFQIADWNVRLKYRSEQLRILTVVAGIVSFCALASASSHSVSLFDFRLPSLCGFKLVTGLDCPGCGITRALILAFHGNFYESYLMHLWGLPLALLLLFQIPYRISRLFDSHRTPCCSSTKVRSWINHSVILSLLLPWAAKTAISVVLKFL